MAKVKQYDSVQIENLDDWVLSGNKLIPKPGIAPDGISIGTAQTTHIAAGDSSTGDFESPGGSVNYVTDHWENSRPLGTNFASGITPTNVSGWSVSDLSHLTDGDESNSNGVASETNATNNPFDLDLGLGNDKVINTFSYVYYYDTASRKPQFVDVSGSDDGTNFNLVENVALSHPNAPGEYAFYFTNTTAYRYWRFNIVKTSGSNFIANEWKMFTATYSTSSNTVDAMIQFSGTKNFAPGTIIIKDENGDEILGTGKINLDYNINGGGMQGSLIGLQTFKTLSTSLFSTATVLKIQVQAVGAQQFSEVNISTTNTEIEIKPSGEVNRKVNGVIIDDLDNKANTDFSNVTPATGRAALNVSQIRTVTEHPSSSGNIAFNDIAKRLLVVTMAGTDDVIVTLGDVANYGRPIRVVRLGSGSGVLTIDAGAGKLINSAQTYIVPVIEGEAVIIEPVNTTMWVKT